MAKCIRLLSTGGVVRTSDEVAKREVGAKRAEYVPKQVWKEAVRDGRS